MLFSHTRLDSSLRLSTEPLLGFYALCFSFALGEWGDPSSSGGSSPKHSAAMLRVLSQWVGVGDLCVLVAHLVGAAGLLVSGFCNPDRMAS